jgi:Type II CAAX prenyl endopeptidase Rce1-like
MLENQKLRLGATLWLAGMAGVAVLSLTVIPQLLERAPQSLPHGVAIAASMAQSGVLLALAVWAGVALSRPLGLGAPSVEAALSGTNVWSALKRQFVPAGIAGVFVGGLLVFFERIAPSELLAIGKSIEIPVAAKLLYGGVTEEILMRWGLMTALIWLPWRFIQKRVGLPRTSYVMGAIVVTALLFGIGHLPAAAAMGVSLNPSVVAYVIAGNAVPGILFGFLYWRYGLEAAIIAHALGHAVATLVAG